MPPIPSELVHLFAKAVPLSTKRKHVKKAGQDRAHHCHWPGCPKQCPPAMWGCRQHWFKLPKYLRDAIWEAYRPGQEKDMRPLREYLKVAHEVQEWIRENWGCEKCQGTGFEKTTHLGPRSRVHITCSDCKGSGEGSNG